MRDRILPRCAECQSELRTPSERFVFQGKIICRSAKMCASTLSQKQHAKVQVAGA